jgi:hypothetical protein
MITSLTFDNPEEYTYDEDKVEIVDGVARLKNQRPDNATCGAILNGSLDLTPWSLGVVTGTPSGTVTQESGYVSLDSGSISYSTDSNIDSRNSGAIIMQIRGQWPDVGPSSDMSIFSIYGDAGEVIGLYINTSGKLMLFPGTSSPIEIDDWSSYTSNTWYTLELNYDFTNGESRLFIDGEKIGGTVHDTHTFTDTIQGFNIGANASGSDLITADIKNLLVFDTPQHTTDTSFDSAYTVPETTYTMDNPKIEAMTSIRTDEILSFVETSNKPSGTGVKYIVYDDGVGYYFDESANNMMPSDGSYAQSTPVDVLVENIEKLTPEGALCSIDIFLHSEDGLVTPELVDVSVEYDLTIETCEIPIRLVDYTNSVVKNPRVSLSLNRYDLWYGDKAIITWDRTRLADADKKGVTTLSLVETDTLSDDNGGVDVYYTLQIGSYIKKFTIPKGTFNSTIEDLPEYVKLLDREVEDELISHSGVDVSDVLEHSEVIPGSLVIKVNDVIVDLKDNDNEDGTGDIYGESVDGIGNINYHTGEIDFSFTADPTPFIISADYKYLG